MVRYCLLNIFKTSVILCPNMESLCYKLSAFSVAEWFVKCNGAKCTEADFIILNVEIYVICHVERSRNAKFYPFRVIHFFCLSKRNEPKKTTPFLRNFLLLVTTASKTIRQTPRRSTAPESRSFARIYSIKRKFNFTQMFFYYNS
ncbi:hypothetical protein SAMN05216480_111134 [Pustulibacterium marinum]|uniref:Uncharacterized protein n=1 Tax=Pustulibacterium marinum TaxID=1224947 RepID=A0A1I7HXW1_9FLAO|nr:hypothetical protein SAMN05216480_111134 [Pustulibacterium marinum]